MSAHLERALLLYDQCRFDLAEQELRDELGADPDNPTAHALLSLCLGQRCRFDDATRQARTAVRMGPDVPLTHYALARVLYDRDHLPEAARAIDEAIQLDPREPDYFALLAGIRFDQGRWEAARAGAELGLAVNPEHIPCANLRAMALVRLGRPDEADEVIAAALAKDPENGFTHANRGWSLLHQGDHGTALGHFREALRLEPQLETAREGIVEALKARNPVYRVMLAYFLWMSRLSSAAQWLVILAGFFGFRALRLVAEVEPDFAPLVWPVVGAYLGFVLLTWIADPLFNLVLRLDRFGRLALSREQVVASNWVGGCLLAAALAVGAWAITPVTDFLFGAGVFALLSMPLAATFNCPFGWPRRAMVVYTSLLAAAGLSGLGLLLAGTFLQGGVEHSPARVTGYVLLGIFFVGAFLSGWAANGLMMVRPRR